MVCGAWKKLPSEIKPVLRGPRAAGVGHRLLPGEFVYVDKNSVALLGGVEQAIKAAAAVDNGPIAVQIKDPNAVTGAVLAGGHRDGGLGATRRPARCASRAPSARTT